MIKKELVKRLEELTDDEISEVLNFVKLLWEPPEELTLEEWEEVRAGREEFAHGEWVR